ncbi:MAG: pyridoxal phosphate-dependent aminotransferase [Ignavibacteriae bacterium]|nr:pyridoxal phosphate-dependent aminotransferase [Ignavibacteriota bacterium]
MNFSNRTSWHCHPNTLSLLLEQKTKRGEKILDLIVSNPTGCGFLFPEEDLLAALSDSRSLKYEPNPRGMLSAREAIVRYYSEKHISIETSKIFLTASTSESYSLIFKLLCNAGEHVLVPRPSYPLFDYLSQVNDVHLRHYDLHYNDEWMLDIQSIRDAINPQTKAIVIINPHNPTGMFLKRHEFEAIKHIAREHSLALIVDEVFIDYAFESTQEIISTTEESDVLTFTLNGISKSCGLPQMKLGWFVVTGSGLQVTETEERLEILCDTFLSVNTPVQVALPRLLQSGENIRQQICKRITTNYTFLQSLSHHHSLITTYQSDGGWYGILRAPQTQTDEEWAIELLEKRNVHLYPGYFFDFQTEGNLVVSLLVEEDTFKLGIKEISCHIQTGS